MILWILDTTPRQFYNNPNGGRLREKRASYRQNYITDNAPGEYVANLVATLMLTDKFLSNTDYYSPQSKRVYEVHQVTTNIVCSEGFLDNNYIRTLHNPRMKLIKDPIAQVGSKSVMMGSGGECSVNFIVSCTQTDAFINHTNHRS